MKKSVIWAVSVVVIMSLVLSAFGCSKSTTTTTKPATTTAATTTATSTTTVAAPVVRGVTKDTISLGNHSALTGSAAYYGSDVIKGIDTAIKVVNAAGGVNGRKFTITQLDDKYDVAQAIAAAKSLVEQTKVFAVVGNVGTANVMAVADYYNDNQVPLVTPTAYDRLLTGKTRPYVYLVGLDYYVTMTTLSKFFIKQGYQKVGYLYQPSSQDGLPGFQDGLGTKLAASLQFAPADTDFSSQILSLQKAGVDMLVFTGTADQGTLLLKQAAQVGFKPKFMFSDALADLKFWALAGSAAEGVYCFSRTPVGTQDLPGVKQLLADAAKYNPGYIPGFAFMNGYLGVKLIANAVQKAGVNFTMQDFINAMDSTTNFDTGGLYGPITYTKTNHNANSFIKIVQWRAGSMDIIENWYNGN